MKRPTLDDWKAQPWWKLLAMYEIYLRELEEYFKEIGIQMSDIEDKEKRKLLGLCVLSNFSAFHGVQSDSRLGEGACPQN